MKNSILSRNILRSKLASSKPIIECNVKLSFVELMRAEQTIKPKDEYTKTVRPGDVPSVDGYGGVRNEDSRDAVVVTSPKPTLSLKNEVEGLWIIYSKA